MLNIRLFRKERTHNRADTPVTGQNGIGQNGTDNIVQTKWYWTKWYRQYLVAILRSRQVATPTFWDGGHGNTGI